MDYKLELSDEVVEKLCDAGYNPAYGARPLKRAIQVCLENPLAEALLKGEFSPGDLIHAKLDTDGRIICSS